MALTKIYVLFDSNLHFFTRSCHSFQGSASVENNALRQVADREHPVSGIMPFNYFQLTSCYGMLILFLVPLWFLICFLTCAVYVTCVLSLI